MGPSEILNLIKKKRIGVHGSHANCPDGTWTSLASWLPDYKPIWHEEHASEGLIAQFQNRLGFQVRSTLAADVIGIWVGAGSWCLRSTLLLEEEWGLQPWFPNFAAQWNHLRLKINKQPSFHPRVYLLLPYIWISLVWNENGIFKSSWNGAMGHQVWDSPSLRKAW